MKKYKARLVAKCNMQGVDIDYEEAFYIIACLETIRLMITLASQNK